MNIIITGASRGIGYETAKILSLNHNVISISRFAEKNKISGVQSIDFDFEKGDIKNELLPKIKNYTSNVDVLINNAATLIKKPFEEISKHDFEKIFQINVLSIALLTQSILSIMKSGHIINIASMGGVQGSVKFNGLSAYSSTKGALITLNECLAEEYKDKNIRFNTIAFGSVQTKMLEEAFPGFRAPLTAETAATFLADFAINGNKYFNGKTLQMALSTP